MHSFDHPDAIKFHIPFDWGNLRVTHLAAADYALTPFAENTLEGDAPAAEPRAHGIHTTITIAGIHEIATVEDPEQPKSTMPANTEPTPAITPILSQPSIDTRHSTVNIYAGFKETAKFVLRSIQRHNSPKVYASGFCSVDGGLRADRRKLLKDEQDISQTMSHILAVRCGQYAVYGQLELSEALNTRSYRHGALSLLGFNAAMLAPVTHQMLSVLATPGATFTPGPLLWGGLLGAAIGTHMIGRQAEADHKSRMSDASSNATSCGTQITKDIHTAFCSTVFDRQMERRLYSQ